MADRLTQPADWYDDTMTLVFPDCPLPDEDEFSDEERIQMVRWIVNDPDAPRFYTEEQLKQMQEWLDAQV